MPHTDRARRLAREPDRVVAPASGVDRRLPALQLIEAAEDVPQLPRPFVVQRFGGLRHPALHRAPHGPGPSAEDLEDFSIIAR